MYRFYVVKGEVKELNILKSQEAIIWAKLLMDKLDITYDISVIIEIAGEPTSEDILNSEFYEEFYNEDDEQCTMLYYSVPDIQECCNLIEKYKYDAINICSKIYLNNFGVCPTEYTVKDITQDTIFNIF